MKESKLPLLLQLAGGTFPTGGFSQSWGLETYVTEERVVNTDDLKKFLTMYLDAVIASCEGPILREAVRHGTEWNLGEIEKLEELSLAMKLSKESRDSALRTGKALMRISAEIIEDQELSDFYKANSQFGVTNAVAFGVICGRLGVSQEEALEAYVFSTANNIVQSAVKLVPLGNTEAQRLLLKMQPIMRGCVQRSMSLAITDISNFNPGLDLASILHETLVVRLYMS
jgi:urease accessory protein